MTPDQFKRIEDFNIFSKAAATRCGSPFLCEVFALAKEAAGEVTVKGKVFLEGASGQEIPVEMEWNLQGDALHPGKQFDLIKEEPFDGTEP